MSYNVVFYEHGDYNSKEILEKAIKEGTPKGGVLIQVLLYPNAVGVVYKEPARKKTPKVVSGLAYLLKSRQTLLCEIMKTLKEFNHNDFGNMCIMLYPRSGQFNNTLQEVFGLEIKRSWVIASKLGLPSLSDIVAAGLLSNLNVIDDYVNTTGVVNKKGQITAESRERLRLKIKELWGIR